jgi:tRNA dimethylallyltransferase
VRLIRALDIFHNSGLPPSEVFKQTRSPFAAYAFIRVGLRLERKKLYQNIDRRVETMLAKGLLAEVQELVRRYPPSCPPFKSLGYKEILSHLRAEIDLPTAVELIKRHSRQFAKRQLSWFRQEKDISWFAPENHAAITRFIKTCLSKKP